MFFNVNLLSIVKLIQVPIPFAFWGSDTIIMGSSHGHIQWHPNSHVV